MRADKVKKILIAVPDGLPRVLEAGDHEMRREDRVRVQRDAVFPPLAPLELNVGLLRRAFQVWNIVQQIPNSSLPDRFWGRSYVHSTSDLEAFL